MQVSEEDLFIRQVEEENYRVYNYNLTQFEKQYLKFFYYHRKTNNDKVNEQNLLKSFMSKAKTGAEASKYKQFIYKDQLK